MNSKIVIGIDEVGCGALAGPIVVVAVAFLPDALPPEVEYKPSKGRSSLLRVADSKALTDKQRRALFDAILTSCAAYSRIYLSPTTVDELGVLEARLQGARLAAAKVIEQLSMNGISKDKLFILLDGKERPEDMPASIKAVPQGDKIHWQISSASIIAKVLRDDFMIELSTVYPDYLLDKHKGYPTEAHVVALAKHGPTPIHRRSFGPVRELLPTAKRIDLMSSIIAQRVPTSVCARCRKVFSPGDRVTQAFIISKVGKSPESPMEIGAFLHPDFEFTHVTCEDPGLVKGVFTL